LHKALVGILNIVDPKIDLQMGHNIAATKRDWLRWSKRYPL